MLETNEALRMQQYDDLRWARRSQRLQENYAGQLVVVHHRTVLAHGLDEEVLLNQAVSDEHPRDELVVVEILPPEFEVPVAVP
jgi:hypothetical protein